MWLEGTRRLSGVPGDAAIGRRPGLSGVQDAALPETVRLSGIPGADASASEQILRGAAGLMGPSFFAVQDDKNR